jgi:hypothetical protein
LLVAGADGQRRLGIGLFERLVAGDMVRVAVRVEDRR